MQKTVRAERREHQRARKRSGRPDPREVEVLPAPCACEVPSGGFMKHVEIQNSKVAASGGAPLVREARARPEGGAGFGAELFGFQSL